MKLGTLKSIFKMLKYWNYRNIATVMNHYPKNGKMGDTEPPHNMLHKTKHTSRSILIYRVGLDPIATSYLAAWIEWTCNIPGWILSSYIAHRKKEPPSESLVWNPLIRLQSINLIRGSICLSLVIAYYLLRFSDDKVIKLHLLFQPTVNSRTTPFIKKNIKNKVIPCLRHWRYYQA